MERSPSIHEAAAQGNTSEVKRWLVSDPALLEARDEKGMTPLHRAAATFSGDHAGTVEILLSSGADPNARDRDNWTPLDWADFCVKRDVIVLLSKTDTL